MGNSVLRDARFLLGWRAPGQLFKKLGELSMSETAGVIGLGIMGGAMARNLMKNGFRVVGCDIDAEKVAAFEAGGGAPKATPADVARAAGIVITSLPKPAALDQVCSGEGGLGQSGRDGLIVIETSTFEIADKERNRDALEAAGIIMLDCPLSGTGAQAAKQDLVIFASGDKAAVDKCAGVFEGFGRSHFHVGPFGNGCRMKYVANLLVAIHNVAAAEAFVLGMKSGLKAEDIYEVIKDGAGNSRIFELRGPMMVEGEYGDATMTMEMWKKDMSVIMGFADQIGAPAPLLNACNPIYTAARAQGMGALDTAAVCAVMEEMADFKRG